MSTGFAANGALKRRSGPSGFTLLEILIALVLLGVLAAIAIPTYSSYVTRGQRAAAKAALLQSAQFLERNYTTFGSYGTGAGGASLTLPTPYAPTDGGQVTYTLTFASQTANTYQLAATPCNEASGTCPNGSNQTFDDTDCGVLTLDNTGLKGASGTIGSSNAAACWSR